MWFLLGKILIRIVAREVGLYSPYRVCTVGKLEATSRGSTLP